MRRKDSGIALLTALGMLVVFSILGGSYLTYMMVENQNVDIDLGAVRARASAEAGLRQAIGAIGADLAGGVVVPEQVDAKVALYKATPDGSLVEDDSRKIEVAVTVFDESSRINVNYAPTRVLAAILGVDPNKARAIRMQLPKIDGDEAATVSVEGARWLASVDELHTRTLVTPDKVRPNLLTVHTGETGSNAGWLNVNTALPEALAAVLDVPVEAAIEIKKAGPFTSVEQLAAAAGKDPSTFNVRPQAPGTLPKELSFSSRCYRIVSHAKYVQDGVPKAGSRVEAVVCYDPDGRPEIRSWNETPGINQSAATNGAADAA
jgi:type II secretory pathway component PulK